MVLKTHQGTNARLKKIKSSKNELYIRKLKKLNNFYTIIRVPMRIYKNSNHLLSKFLNSFSDAHTTVASICTLLRTSNRTGTRIPCVFYSAYGKLQPKETASVFLAQVPRKYLVLRPWYFLGTGARPKTGKVLTYCTEVTGAKNGTVLCASKANFVGQNCASYLLPLFESCPQFSAK